MTKTTNNQQRTLFKTKPNKAKVKIGKMGIRVARIKDYDDEQQTTNNERIQNKTKQSQSFEFAQDRSCDYPCVFASAEYNLVLRNDNAMHSMPNGRNLDGEYVKWRKHRKQMQ